MTLKAWDRELVKVDVGYLLPTLNEMLLSAPVLVQAFSYAPGGADPQMLDVLLPLEPSLVPFCDREGAPHSLPAPPTAACDSSLLPTHAPLLSVCLR